MARPAFTYTRVVALIIRDGSILLTPPWETEHGAQRLWNAPGGALEPYESLQDALKREVREEIGAEIEPLGLAFLTQEPRGAIESGSDPDRPVMSIEICCYARMISNDDALRPERPFIPAPIWVPMEQVPTLPTLPFSLRGWAKWVTDSGKVPEGSPVVAARGGSELDSQFNLFSRPWSIGSSEA